MEMTLSQSRAKTWRRCKAQFNFKYNLNLKRRRVKRPLSFGTFVHEMLDAEANGKDPYSHIRKFAKKKMKEDRIFTAEKDLYYEILDDALLVMGEYFKFWPKRHLRYISIKGKKTEHKFEWQPPGEDFLITGRIDAFARTKNRLKWLVEHKSGKKIMPEDERWRNLQVAVYKKVAHELNYIGDIDGICWNMLRSKSPTRPQLLVGGTLSLKKLDTLPSAILDTIKKLGKNPKDYPTLLDNAKRNRNQWFQRIFHPISGEVLDHLYRDFIDTGREIVQGYEGVKKQPTKTIERHCSWCDFEPICRAELTGSDPEFVIEREYLRNEKTTKPTKKKKRQSGKKT